MKEPKQYAVLGRSIKTGELLGVCTWYTDILPKIGEARLFEAESEFNYNGTVRRSKMFIKNIPKVLKKKLADLKERAEETGEFSEVFVVRLRSKTCPVKPTYTAGNIHCVKFTEK